MTNIPQNVGWTVGNYCPYNCKHCYSASVRKSEAGLTKTICDKIISELHELGIKTVNIGGNEPIFTNGSDLSKSLLPYIIISLHNKGLDVGITTSGITLLHLYEHYRNVFDLINDFDISLDSPFKDEHNTNRGANLYDQAIKTLNICHKERKAATIIMTAMNWNFDKRHIDSLLDLCRRTSSYFRFNVMRPIVKEHMALILSPEQYFAGFIYLIEKAEILDLSDPVIKSICKTETSFKRCPCGINSFRINGMAKDGAIGISPCVYLHDFKSSMDVVTHGIAAIINSHEFAKFKERYDNPQTIKGCQDCPVYDICGGGCAARAYLHNLHLNGDADLMVNDPYCPIGHVEFRSLTPSLFQEVKNLVHMNYLCTFIGRPK